MELTEEKRRVKEYRLINRHNPMSGIKIGDQFNGRTIVEIFEPEFSFDFTGRKRKKYFVIVQCPCGRRERIEIRGAIGHGCPSCSAAEWQKDILWRYNPVF